MLSTEKEREIEIAVVKHLCRCKPDFETGELQEDLISNMDETAFHINIDDGKTLNWKGVVDCKYPDVSSGGQHFTLIGHVSGGLLVNIMPGFSVFQNAGRNYPICGVLDTVPGDSYRTWPNGWIDSRVLLDMFKDLRYIQRDEHGRREVIFVDDVGSHNSGD